MRKNIFKFLSVVLFVLIFFTGCGQSEGGTQTNSAISDTLRKRTADSSKESAPKATSKPTYKYAQTIKTEDMTGVTEMGSVSVQGMGGWNGKSDRQEWADGTQLWWCRGDNRDVGDTLDITFSVDKAGIYLIEASLTMAKDYGIFDFSVDGKIISDEIDLFYADDVIKDEYEIGIASFAKGENTITVTIQGGNPDMFSDGNSTGYMFGIDYFTLSISE